MKSVSVHTPMDFATVVIEQEVQVHSFGCWYDGVVKTIAFGRRRIAVEYVTSGGKRTKAFTPTYVAPAGSYPAGQRIELVVAPAGAAERARVVQRRVAAGDKVLVNWGAAR